MSADLIAALDRYLRQDETAGDTDNGVYRQGLAAMSAALSSKEAEPREEPLVWESTTSAYIKFITDSRYRKFSPAVQKWYRPVCQKCATTQALQEVKP